MYDFKILKYNLNKILWYWNLVNILIVDYIIIELKVDLIGYNLNNGLEIYGYLVVEFLGKCFCKFYIMVLMLKYENLCFNFWK